MFSEGLGEFVIRPTVEAEVFRMYLLTEAYRDYRSKYNDRNRHVVGKNEALEGFLGI